jgi:prepilin-type N-terminal cleavage/methylation domain-containing protein
MKSRAGFSLFEIMIAVAILAMVMTLAVPSVTSLLREQKLKETFEGFDGFVQQVRTQGATTRKDLLIVWDKDGLSVLPQTDADGEPLHFTPPEGSLTIERTAALGKDPAPEWIFWQSGICEPAIISYSGPAGSWKVQYDPLTGHGTFLSEEVR